MFELFFAIIFIIPLWKNSIFLSDLYLITIVAFEFSFANIFTLSIKFKLSLLKILSIFIFFSSLPSISILIFLFAFSST